MKIGRKCTLGDVKGVSFGWSWLKPLAQLVSWLGVVIPSHLTGWGCPDRLLQSNGKGWFQCTQPHWACLRHVGCGETAHPALITSERELSKTFIRASMIICSYCFFWSPLIATVLLYIKNCPLCTGLVFFRKLFNMSMLMRTCKHSNHGWIIWILMALIQAFKVGSCKRQAIWSFWPHHRFGRIGDLTIPLATEFAVRNWFRVWCLLEWPRTKWGSYDNHNGWVDEKRIWH